MIPLIIGAFAVGGAIAGAKIGGEVGKKQDEDEKNAFSKGFKTGVQVTNAVNEGEKKGTIGSIDDM